MVDAAFEAGIRPRCHLEDVTRADIEGFVLPFAERLVRMSEQVPADKTAKIRLCDTMGFGLSYPGVALPRSIPKLVYKLNQEVGVPSDRLEWHGHNDFHKVHINGATAWLYGCDALNATLFGFGERTGNPPLERRRVRVHRHQGRTVRRAHGDHYRAGRLHAFHRHADPGQLPVRGPEFQHHAGRHPRRRPPPGRADLQHLRHGDAPAAARPGSRSPTRAGPTAWPTGSTSFFGLKGDQRISKIKMHKLARWVMDQYEVHGRLTAVSDQEMEAKVKELMPDHWAKHGPR